MNNKGKGLLAALGLAAGAGALAFWKYKKMSPEEKQNLKDKANKTGRKIKEKAGEVEDTISEKYDQLKNSAKREASNLKEDAKDYKNEAKDIVS
ncbi:YtxH domain-containing protein [Aequorivita capsosiphonis]|uniref:YtxH domain-containing protein n=1 Tax=Aequorivita capsosiphonis TaxID=487317 RepID=UPI0004094A70|nr:YtxH domain-containing protein [Aequorivita capsosiphonis]